MALPKLAALAVKAATAAKAAGAVKTVIGAAKLAATGASILGGVGEIIEGNEARRQGEQEYQGALAEAKAMRLGKGAVYEAGALQVGRIGDQGRTVASEYQAGAAASGFDPGDQTGSLIQQNIAAKTRMQQLLEQARADDEANGLDYNASLTELRGAYALQNAKRQQKLSRVVGGASILAGAYSAYGRYGKPRLPSGGSAVAGGGSGFVPSDRFAAAQRAAKAAAKRGGG